MSEQVSSKFLSIAAWPRKAFAKKMICSSANQPNNEMFGNLGTSTISATAFHVCSPTRSVASRVDCLTECVLTASAFQSSSWEGQVYSLYSTQPLKCSVNWVSYRIPGSFLVLNQSSLESQCDTSVQKIIKITHLWALITWEDCLHPHVHRLLVIWLYVKCYG